MHDLLNLLDTAAVEYQYPEFIGDKQKPHVTQRNNIQFTHSSKHIAYVVYLVEFVDKARIGRARFKLDLT